ncbi:proline-rich receptor-like protein kinase PERK15 [Cornus florida]|uniref:proline-rich receptor-like protein kinase PERK15 n=1 Tax=Cornus florida TaxID=4283 RepID=UPI002897B521|nr:proline-rich receptor-like protein kinase PERK15 [Cornus florida]
MASALLPNPEPVMFSPPWPPLQAPSRAWGESSPPWPPLQAPTPAWGESSPLQAPQPAVRGKRSPLLTPLRALPPVWGESWPSASTKNNAKWVAALSTVGIGIPVILIAVGILIWYKRKRRHALAASITGLQSQQWQQDVSPPTRDTIAMLQRPSIPPPPPSSVDNSVGLDKQSSGSRLGYSKTIFTYEELAKATSDFSEANFLGQGGFGNVLKGVFPNGEEVAIKQLKVGSEQGDREFQAEIDIISRVHHKHLVSLAGYCIYGAQRLLVYEFVPNKTLEFHLHEKEGPPLSWGIRMKIALGSAKGLAYLHEDCHPKIIHRDIKSANILLDYSFEAKVADFGLARFNSDTVTHISTRVMGTFGYLAPEYALTGKLTEKSDVFSFGVVLLELITGRQPIGKAQVFLDENIVDWARPLLTKALEDNNFDTLADPRLQKDYDSFEMARMVICAATCVRHLARRRPRMSQIVRALEGNMSLDELSEGSRPGHSTVYYNSHENSDYDKAQYKEDLKKFKKMALGISQEHGASECSGTSEFGVKSSVSSTSEGQQTTQEMSSGSDIQQSIRGGTANQ